MSGHPGRPPGFVRTTSVNFTTPPEPAPGDVSETFTGHQWRILEVRLAKTRYQVTEVKLDPSEHVEDPEWRFQLGS